MSQIPPLLGDGHGRYRVHIVGNSGAGKSTLGVELASILGVPYIPLDPLFWNPNWTPSTPEEFQVKVLKRLMEDERGWVVDGNYGSRLGDLVTERRTDIVWLDPPFVLYFARLVVRTLQRLFGLKDNCAPGCSETLAHVFLSKEESILYWAITHHSVVRRRESENLQRWGVHVGGNMRRIGGWGTELKLWKQAVVDMVKGM
ncbi:hypothetical protein BKA82DRAFT_4131328 [Pisolithus tinctorius]|uniref:Adenylate kinase n=1 Tax=Pisolithus tinctorius Marx 270 TaxID=870435 RepID=A0A0C3NP55_PISTI|nr:hypothetical protein BKA82DRAFT_4131328 [Pisolithus tinctorius]KIN97093.1 hypothetical protein M404DRAFT_1006365 [Pisolithus tinctorius Marx 270]